MHPTLHLFYLIKNLDTAEVKYFRAYAKRKVTSGTSSPLVLFDLIFQSSVYDEETYEKKINVSNFPALKVYLYDMIAEAMLEREMKKKGLPEIFALAQQAEMFQRKGLMDGMWKKLEKAMLLCERYEEFSIWRDLLRKKRTILMLDAGEGHTPGGMESFDELYQEVKLKAKNLEEYKDLEDIVEVTQRKCYLEKFHVATSLLSNPFLADGISFLSRKAEIKYYWIKRNALRWANQNANATSYSVKLVALLEDSPYLMLDPELQLKYISRLYHIGMYAAATHNFDEAYKTLEKLRGVQGLPMPIFEREHSIELQIAFERADKANGEISIAKIAKGLEAFEYKLKGERKVAYYFQIAHFLLFFAEPEKALKWVLKLREIENADLKRDLQDFGEVLFLVCHFDLKNFDFIIKSETDKALHYLSKRNALSLYEETIIKGLRKCAKANTQANRKNRLVRLGNQLRELVEKPEYKYRDNYFQFDVWIASKLNGKSPIETLLASGARFV